MLLHKAVIAEAIAKLDRGLKLLEGSEKVFFSNYRSVRQRAFTVEFLGKLLHHDELAVRAKVIEDQLGEFNEYDEQYLFVRDQKITSYERRFLAARERSYSEAREWLKTEGWVGSGHSVSQIHKLRLACGNIPWLDNEEFTHQVGKRVAKTLRKLQHAIDDGEYSPAHRDGYRSKEIETKVHELRRDIRKVSMYMAYVNGVFVLKDSALTAEQRKLVDHYAPLAKSTLASESFAKLPRPRVRNPIAVPRNLFLALTRYVAELGAAKDWAYRLESLGADHDIYFDHLDLGLRNIFSEPIPFNALTLGIIDEIRKKRVFKNMAAIIEPQASKVNDAEEKN